MLKIYNTLTRSIEEFKPINPLRVGMYTCGPTVYDSMHIGNLRTFVLSDILVRVFTYNGYDVKFVQNITDIEDKIIKRAAERRQTISELTYEFTKYFLDDSSKLHILKPNQQPRATEYIDKMVLYIKALLDKGFAYTEKDGSVYFDISKFPQYGKLSVVKKENLKTGTRVLSDEYTKDDVRDFALWKTVPKGEMGSFESELGWGRPGWHIECSVMSQDILGDTFDVHVGGVDLIFPHHENEIAQSEAKTGKKFVNYFVHGAHMLVDGKKMSKSLGNFYTLKDVEEKGFDPLALRYLYLQTHYRQEMNFTLEALEGAQNALNNLKEQVQSWEILEELLDEPESQKGVVPEFETKFLGAVNNDFNMPEALSIVWELVKSDYPGSAKIKSLLKFDEVLGLGLGERGKGKGERGKVPEKVQTLVQKRENLRRGGKFEEADKIRLEIESMGYMVEDTDSGTKVKQSDS